MRCSNIGPRGARNWFRVLDSPRQLLSPSHPDVFALRRPASASWVLREAKQVAPTTRLAGHEPSKSRCAPPGSHAAPPAKTLAVTPSPPAASAPPALVSRKRCPPPFSTHQLRS